MLLRRLEAYGFKSFAEKTELEFGRGITAIVGPNGSGKSNISDAIRWVLGEQSLRTLRGTKMEDVIFAGSAKRRPLGVAEVSLVLDNSDGQLPLDFNEVTITRRVFRSGDSEYYINKTACRLKDIHEMLADTGLGRDSMTVIGQNKVDEILSSKPEERRLLFEEAAGIIKYKQRKREALRKLEDTEQNLTRVQDIIAELQIQIEPLKESAARTVSFNTLSRELKACQATLLLERLEKAEKLVEGAKQEQTQLTDQNIAVTTALTTADIEKESLAVTLAYTEEKLASGDKALADMTAECEQLDNRSGILTERSEQAGKAAARLSHELERVTGEQAAEAAKLTELKRLLADKQEQAAAYQQLAEEKTGCNNDLLRSIQQLEICLADGQEKSFDHLQQVVNARNLLRMLERELAALTEKQGILAAEYADYASQQAALGSDQAELDNELQQLTLQQQELQQQNLSLAHARTQGENQLAAIAEKEHQIAGAIQERSSRLKVLTGMQYELEGFNRAIKAILTRQDSWRKGICGAVAQLFTVPDKYITAVEIALGGAQQYIVTDTDQTAKQAIQFLKLQNLGRATFLPLHTIRPARPKDTELLAVNQPGAICFAAEVVKVDERFRPVVEYLLGRVIIAGTIDQAVTIARNCGFTVRIVTLEGELVNPGGSLTGGSRGRKEASFLARTNEINTLQQSVEKLTGQQSRVVQEKHTQTAELAVVNSQLAGIEAALQKAELRRSELAIYLERNRLDVRKCELARKTIDSEKTECQEQAAECQVKFTQGKTALLQWENQASSHKSKVTEWQSQLTVMKDRQLTVNEELTDAKIKWTAAAQEIATAGTACQQSRDNYGALQRQLAQLQQEKAQIQTETGQAQAELARLAVRKAKLQQDKAQLARQRQDAYTAKLEVLAALQQLDKTGKDLRRQSNELQSRLHERELLITKYSYEAANCREQLTGQLGLTVAEAETIRKPDSLAGLLSAIKQLESQIAALGPVNPAAVDEYNKVQERYAFLQGQTEDLLQAKAYLASIISDIDATMSRQFTKAFKAINLSFGEVFARLFGGGQAELVLLEPGAMLSSGIDIVVQPPGKKLQNLALLSGGERALTVIALLFAILTYRPAPFCVVDEIDAALDEANVARFSEFLQDYAQHTQFIIVTHRKGTMEAAGVLHGITMEESGISRLVSVKFMDKAG